MPNPRKALPEVEVRRGHEGGALEDADFRLEAVRHGFPLHPRGGTRKGGILRRSIWASQATQPTLVDIVLHLDAHPELKAAVLRHYGKDESNG